MAIDYQQLEDAARAELEPLLDRLKGLGLVYAMFLASGELGKQLLEHLSSPDLWIKYALTRTMVIEYAKPFTLNRERVVTKVMRGQTFLTPVTSKPLHQALVDNRDQASAHLDTGAQPHGVGLIGAEAANQYSLPRRFAELPIPMMVRMDVAIPVNPTDIAEVQTLLDHVDEARALTANELRAAVEAVRNAALQHSPVLNRVGDMVSFASVRPNASGNYEMQPTGTTASPITSQQSQVATISGLAYSEALMVTEITPDVEITVSGNGFRLESTQIARGEVEITATFLDWHP